MEEDTPLRVEEKDTTDVDMMGPEDQCHDH